MIIRDYSDSEYRETMHISLSEEEIAQIKNYITKITKGKSYNDLSYTERFAPQILIWQMWQEKSGVPLSYMFDVGFTKDYEEILKKEELPTIYTFRTRVGETLTMNFLPTFQATYHIEPLDNTFEIVESENEFKITANQIGKYHYKIESSYFDEIIKYYAHEDDEMIEVVKPKIPNSEIYVLVEEKLKQEHDVLILKNEGIFLQTEKQKYQEEEQVTISYNLEEDYVLDSIEVYSASGKKITVRNNSFEMPKENVIIQGITHQLPKYKIITRNNSEVTVELPEKVKPGDVVELNYKLPENLELISIDLITESGQILDRKGNTFIMPEENVFLEIHTKKKMIPTYDIYSFDVEGIKIDIPKSAKEKEPITFSYQLKEGYTLTFLEVLTKENKKIPIQENTFLMPAESVFINVKVTKRVPEEKQTYPVVILPQEGITFAVHEEYTINEVVQMNYTLASDYELVDLKVLKENGEYVDVQKNQFIMPNCTVMILAKTEKKQEILASKKNVYFSQKEGITFDIKEKYIPGETVTFNYQLGDDYVLEKLEVYTTAKETVRLIDHKFIMPDCDIVIEVKTKKKTHKHNIFVLPTKGGKIEIEKENFEGKKIKFTYDLESNFELDSIHLYTITGQEITIQENSFFMPNNDIVVVMNTKEKEKPTYKINVEKDSNVEVLTFDEGQENDEVVLKYYVKDRYILKEFFITDAFGTEIQLQNGKFIMPSSDIWITLRTCENKVQENASASIANKIPSKEPIKEELISKNKTPQKMTPNQKLEETPIIESEEYEKFQVPNTKKDRNFTIIIFFLFLILGYNICKKV